MSLVQNLLMKILPVRWAQEMEAESRSWRVRCPCGREKSIWDLGGVRWKASGARTFYGVCTECGWAGAKEVYQVAPDAERKE